MFSSNDYANIEVYKVQPQMREEAFRPVVDQNSKCFNSIICGSCKLQVLELESYFIQTFQS